MNIPINVFCNHPEAVLPEYKTNGSCAFDLTIIEDAIIQPGEIVRLRTGLVMCVPAGYTLLISARSSLPKKFGLCVPQGFGIVDQDYCGPNDELLLQLLNFTKEPVMVKTGDRLAQGMFVPIMKCDFNEVQNLAHQSRGGFGSTG